MPSPGRAGDIHPHQPGDWAHQPHLPVKGRPQGWEEGCHSAQPERQSHTLEAKEGLSGSGGQGDGPLVTCNGISRS